MKRRRFWPRAQVWLTLLVFATYAAAAATVVIHALDRPYRDLQPMPAGVNASPDDRAMAAARMAAIYRARSGTPFSALPAGTMMEIQWPDGSRETLRVVDPLSPHGIVPVRDSEPSVR